MVRQPRVSPPGQKKLRLYRERYEALNLATVPVASREKRPLQAGWQDPDPSLWQQAPPDANLGIVTGRPSKGLLVIDIDQETQLVHLFGPDLEALASQTLVVETRRGYHVYSRSSPAPSFQLPGDAGDAKGQGGLVVAPPSVHPSGVAYRLVGEAEQVAPLASLDPRFTIPPAATQPPPGRVEAPTKASPRLVRRVEAFVRSQAPRFRLQVKRLRQGTAQDRSGAEFMLAKGMAEAGFETDEIASILLTWGQKAPQRDLSYLQRTVARAEQAAQRSRVGTGGGEN